MSEVKNIREAMVAIPAGKIDLRDDRIQRKWSVEVAPFLISPYPVTQALYFAVMHENPCLFKGQNLPVEQVSWLDAVMFCNALSVQTGLTACYLFDKEECSLDPDADGYRLPAEAEWEYACRAGSTAPRYGDIDRIAWYKANSEGSTHEVGTKEPNAWGLYDMLGNVWEWCSDIYDETVYGSYRIFRGGGWCDEERGCLATNRRRSHPVSFRIDDLGFRLARNLK